jgi:hypothetical protein
MILLLLIGIGSIGIAAATGLMEQTNSANRAAVSFESRLPKNWKIDKSVEADVRQTAAFSTMLGGSITKLINNFLLIDGAKLQVNTVDCPDSKSADAVEAALIKVHRGSLQVFRNGNQIVEFVGADSRLILDAKNRLFLDVRRQYVVEFDAAPLDACADYMKWNDFFNLCLDLEKDPNNAAVLDKLAAMKMIFTLSDRLGLSEFGNGKTANRYRLSSVSTDDLADEVRTFRCNKLPTKFDLPYVHVTAQIESLTYSSRPSKAKISTQGNLHWPTNDPAIAKLAQEITAACTTDEQRIEAILTWLQPGKNLKYGGEQMGSRYGVQQVLKQRFGRCWDFSDLFITLCRHCGIPCRQVYGWLDKQSGHVWAEIMIKGNIIAYDPTAGLQTTSDYIPFAVSDEGDIPFVYLSSVKIRQQ